MPRSRKRNLSARAQLAHGTVRGSWTGSQHVRAVGGLHRQLIIQWHGRQLAVNIWQIGRVHVQGKGAGRFARLLFLLMLLHWIRMLRLQRLLLLLYLHRAILRLFVSRALQARWEVSVSPPVNRFSEP